MGELDSKTPSRLRTILKSHDRVLLERSRPGRDPSIRYRHCLLVPPRALHPNNMLLGGGVIYMPPEYYIEAAVLPVFATSSLVITMVQNTRTERVLETGDRRGGGEARPGQSAAAFSTRVTVVKARAVGGLPVQRKALLQIY